MIVERRGKNPASFSFIYEISRIKEKDEL